MCPFALVGEMDDHCPTTTAGKVWSSLQAHDTSSIHTMINTLPGNEKKVLLRISITHMQ